MKIATIRWRRSSSRRPSSAGARAEVMAAAIALSLCAWLAGCASDPHDRETDVQRMHEARLTQKCSGASIEMRKSIIEAIVRGGVIGVHTAAVMPIETMLTLVGSCAASSVVR